MPRFSRLFTKSPVLPAELKVHPRVGDHEIICAACARLESELFHRRRHNLNNGRNASFGLQPVPFHSSFSELELCADRPGAKPKERCAICQALLRACLLSKVTLTSVRRLENSDRGQLRARLLCDDEALAEGHGSDVVLELFVNGIKGPERIATLPCSGTRKPEQFYLPANPHDPEMFVDPLRWLGECKANHPRCAKLKWSRRNPNWLIRIHSSDSAQLVATRNTETLLGYCALSYCWGAPPKGSPPISKEADLQRRKSNFSRRQKPFPLKDLQPTIHDAATVARKLGLSYIWVDAICIDPSSGWEGEANMMHEVYGNSALTLYTAAASDANQGFLHSRSAWEFRRRPCKLGDQWLDDTRDAQVWPGTRRGDDPLAQRGWICQEERLSPRILYATAQGWYWSCAEGRRNEITDRISKDEGLLTPSVKNQVSVTHGSYKAFDLANGLDSFASSPVDDLPQSFLSLRFDPDLTLLHTVWHQILESYTARSLTNPSDRLIALSGLAALYFDARVPSATNGGKASIDSTEEYLTGLWRATFAADLCWEVIGKANPDESLWDLAPAWSWASLPLSTQTVQSQTSFNSTNNRFLPAESFALVTEVIHRPGLDLSDRIQAGAEADKLCVRGRFRPFVAPGATYVPWEKTFWPGNKDEDMSASIFSRDPDSGTRVYSREARREGVVASIDYIARKQKPPSEILHAALPYGEEKNLWCLEVGMRAMLLLIKLEVGGKEYWRRIGIAKGYRADFFLGSVVQEVILMGRRSEEQSPRA